MAFFNDDLHKEAAENEAGCVNISPENESDRQESHEELKYSQPNDAGFVNEGEQPGAGQEQAQPHSTPASALEAWIAKSEIMRSRELAYISGKKWKNPFCISAGGDFQQPFTVSGIFFLMVIDKNFPERCDDQTIPVKIYLVTPIEELVKTYGDWIRRGIVRDSAGNLYLELPEVEQGYERYAAGKIKYSIVEEAIAFCQGWVFSIQNKSKKAKKRKNHDGRGLLGAFVNPVQDRNGAAGSCRPKYVDGRVSRRAQVNPRCRKVVLSDRALVQIFNESRARIETETGGLFLGHFENGVWYVVEASDPGINAKFYNAYHEGDDVYENHVCGVISRTYKHPLVFLGMWHRHPGSLDTFSGTDDGTNYKYAGSAGNGCISAIINYDPEFRMTFYYVEQGENGNVFYTMVDHETGNSKFANQEMLKVATVKDIEERLKRED